MKISIINGSPKLGESNSGILIAQLVGKMQGAEVQVYSVSKSLLKEAQIEEIAQSDSIVFAFPLYIDSVPSNLMRCLVQLKEQAMFRSETKVYCMVNNGFFEGHQNNVVMDTMRNWCVRVGLSWGQGIGVGAGEMIGIVRNVPLGHGPNKNLGTALEALSSHILTGASEEDFYFSPNFPQPLWKISAHQFWYSSGKANQLKRKNLWK